MSADMFNHYFIFRQNDLFITDKHNSKIAKRCYISPPYCVLCLFNYIQLCWQLANSFIVGIVGDCSENLLLLLSLKGQCHVIVFKWLTNGLKYFRIWFRFC